MFNKLLKGLNENIPSLIVNGDIVIAYLIRTKDTTETSTYLSAMWKANRL